MEERLCYACVKVTEKVSQLSSFVWVDQTTLKALGTLHARTRRHTYGNQRLYLTQAGNEWCCPHPAWPGEFFPAVCRLI